MDDAYTICNPREEPIYGKDAYTICNPGEEPIYGNILHRMDQNTPSDEDIYDDVVPEEETYNYINNPNTSVSFEYPNPVFVGASTQSIREQRVEGNTQNIERKEKPTKRENCGICSVFILLLITDVAVIGIGVYYYIVFTDSLHKVKLENNDLILATIAKLNSLNLTSLLGNEALVNQEAQIKATIVKLNSLDVSRLLSNEVLMNQEAQIKGLKDAVRELKLTQSVDGGYSPWSNYTTCSKSCGTGFQTRNRTCDNPPPKFYGRNCTRLGNSTEKRICNTIICPGSIFLAPKIVKEGEGLNLTCNSTEINATYIWKFNGAPQSGRTDAVWNIPTTTTSNDGSYSCDVTKNGTVLTKVTRVTILYLDQPVVSVLPTSPKEGDTIIFTCNGTSNDGTMTYAWYHNDALISGAASKTYIHRNAQKTNDNGNYHCTIKTTDFTKVSAKKNLVLRYLDQPVALFLPPSPKEGDTIIFKCNGTSNDGTMTYAWYHNDALISGAASKTYILRNSQKTNDNGNYHCTIKTTGFTKVSAKKNLALRYLDQPVVEIFPTSPEEGENITFTCNGASNDGTMTYAWYHKNALISGAASITYILRNAQKTNDSGNYHCTIKTTDFTKVSAKKYLAIRLWVSMGKNICYGNKGSAYGTITFDQNCDLVSMRLSHVSGGFAERGTVTRWGVKTGGNEYWFWTVVTDTADKVVLPIEAKSVFYGLHKIDGFTQNDAFITFKTTQAIKVSKNEVKRVWFIPDLINMAEDRYPGRHCVDVDVLCPGPIDGGYSSWSAYGACTKSCDTGIQIRNRTCDAPSPQYGGKNCSHLGKDKEERSCSTWACPRYRVVYSGSCASVSEQICRDFAISKGYSFEMIPRYGYAIPGCYTYTNVVNYNRNFKANSPCGVPYGYGCLCT